MSPDGAYGKVFREAANWAIARMEEDRAELVGIAGSLGDEWIHKSSILLTPAQKAAIRWPDENSINALFLYIANTNKEKEYADHLFETVTTCIKHALRDLIDE